MSTVLPVDRDLAVLADRVGWEERQLLRAAEAAGIDAGWFDDGSICAGPDDSLAKTDAVVMVRSKSFVRGPLLAELLEDAGATVVNGPAAIATCADKLRTLRRLHAAAVPVVPFRLVLTRADLELAVERLGLPLVLKPLSGGFGRCVMLGRDADLVHSVYDYVEHHGRGFEKALLAQPCIDGEDVRVVAAGGEIVTALTRAPGADWRANVSTGAEVRRISVDDDLRRIVTSTLQTLDLVFAGVDLFRVADGYLVSEVNHVPEFRGAAAVSDVDIADLMVRTAMASAA